MNSKLVKDIMSQKDLAIIKPMAPVREALELMRDKKVKSLIVDKIRPSDAYGILTYKNVLFSIIANDEDIDLLRVYDVCTKPAYQISQQLDVKYAVQLMVRSNVKRLLVVDNNEIEGILTMTDVMDNYLEDI